MIKKKMDLKYPLVCFDLDGTLVDDTIYIWKTLHEGFNTNKEKRDWAYNSFFDNKITYRQWFLHDLELLREAGATKQAMLKMFKVLTPMPGVFKTLETLKQEGHKIAIISGSVSLVIELLFPDFKFDHLLINTIDFDQNGLISGGTHTPFDVQAKADGLEYLCKLENLTSEQAVFIGDNENDLWIAQKAGLSIAFNCKSLKLSQISHVEIKQKNLTLILEYIN